MEDRQSRLLLIMAVVLAALLAVLVFVEPPEGSDVDAVDGEPRWTRVFPDVEAEAVQSLRWTHAGGEVALSRTADGWQLTAPLRGTADATRANGIAAALTRVEAADAIELSHDPAEYGLDEGGAVRVVAETADGRTLSLVVGDDLPVGGGTYILDAAGALRPTRLPLTTTFPADGGALRAREVVRFAASAVDRVVLAGSVRSLVLEKDPHGWWVEERGAPVEGGVAPVAAGRHRADADRVSSLLSGLQELRVTDFPGAPLALSGPGLAITVRAGGEEHTVTLGAGADGAPLVIGPALDGPAPADLGGIDRLVAAPGVAWRSRTLLPVRALTLDALRVELGGVALEASRDGLTWSDPAASRVIDALAEIQVDRGPGGLPTPTGAAWGRVRLSAGAAGVEEVELYQETPEGGRVARDLAGGDAFLVPSEAVRALEAALATPP